MAATLRRVLGGAVSVRTRPGCRSVLAIEQLEGQRPADDMGFDEAHVNGIAQREDAIRALAAQHMVGGVVVVEILRQGADRDQTIGAETVQGDEHAEARDAGNAAGKAGADAVAQIRRDIAVDGLALGGRGAALGRGDVLGGRFEVDGAGFEDAAVTQPQAGDERTMDEQIGVAADR